MQKPKRAAVVPRTFDGAPHAYSRVRLLREIREAHTKLLWTLNRTDAPGKRSRTLAAKKLMRSSWELYRVLTGSEG